ncbi:MAG: IS3 family transposase [bacterium]
MRYAFIRGHREEFRVRKMCEVLEVSRSGFYTWLRIPESERSHANRALLSEMRIAFDRSRRTYGSPRLTVELNESGVSCSENRVARLMRLSGIRAVVKRKYRVTTNSKHNHPVAENLLNRQFSSDRPNAVWLSDITSIWTSEGWLYLAGVIDVHSRMLVGWSMSHRVTAELTLDALRQAIARREIRPKLMHHSDRGGQYAATEYQKLLTETEMIGSRSRKGDCWDNAPMESFFATLSVNAGVKVSQRAVEKCTTRAQS